MNKYLEKIAKEESSNLGLAAQGVTGAALASGAPSRLLGYHNVYHGTSKGVAEKIRAEGFDPSKGGSGAAGHSGSQGFIDQSKGKVHVSKHKYIARGFAAYTTDAEKLRQKGFSSSKVHSKASTSMMKGMFNPFSRKGEVIKSRISDNAWRNHFEKDPHMGGDKNTAATTSKKISTSSIVGHKDNKGISQFLNKKHLKNYYSQSSGKIRGLAGLGLGLSGAGLIGQAVYKKLNQD